VSARGVARVTATTVLALAVSSAAVAATEARELWVRRYSASNADSARAIGVSPDGAKLFVTGQANGLVTIAYDASGKRLWLARDQGAGEALAVSPDGSTVYVTGTSRASGYETVAYDAATGARLWAQREPASGGCCPSSAAAVGVSPDGSRVFVTGWLVVNAASGFDCVTIAYDAATGARLWTTRYNGPANLDDAAVALAVSADGSKLLVTGGVDGAQMYRVYSAGDTTGRRMAPTGRTRSA
jgi:outer membrane protein assembly factor BamB